MATDEEYLSAASVKPSLRTDAQKQLVSDGKNILAVKNADFEAARQERIHGIR